MRSVLLLVALFSVTALAVSLGPADAVHKMAFRAFVMRYNKSYTVEERQKRFAIFVDNVNFINSFNAQNHTFTVAINNFADLTNDEFVSMMNGYKYNPNRPRTPYVERTNAAGVSCPANGQEFTCDWRQGNAVTPIKNQGQCGDCWAFSAVASTEGQHALSTKNLVSLSEQNLVDCSQAEGNQGCNGGLMDDAFKYIIKNKGIDTEASYPYKAVQGKCHYSTANIGATLSSFQDIPKDNEQALTTAIQTVGPISVAIDASHQSFQFYSGGVYYEPRCSSTQLDHGVTAVGYGSLNNSAFYLVKNSWGTSWGISGYILMSRNRNNNCGIATDASYPIV